MQDLLRREQTEKKKCGRECSRFFKEKGGEIRDESEIYATKLVATYREMLNDYFIKAVMRLLSDYNCMLCYQTVIALLFESFRLR